jgi:hypothetical protein
VVSGADDKDVEAIIAELARQGLADQAQLVSEMRSGAGMLLAAGSLIASFLGSESLSRGGLTWVAWLAIAAFVTSMLTTLYVLVPKLSLRFSVPTTDVQAALTDAPVPHEVHASVTKLGEALFGQNMPVMRRLQATYVTAVGAVAAQVILWVAQLAATM